jgi:rare lipoprotein A (peptidoglycan hydrolase)
MSWVSRPRLLARFIAIAASTMALVGLVCLRPPSADAQSRQARQKVDEYTSKTQEIRRRYDELVAQIERTQQAVLAKQQDIVLVSGELLRRQEELARKTVEFQHLIRLAYKYGPADVAGAVLTAKSFSEAGLARRYIGSRIDSHRRALDDMVAAQIAVASLADQLEQERGALTAEIDRLADTLDATQLALVDAEAALAAAKEELRIREEMERAYRIIQSSGSGRRYSERHRISTERQAEILARYPFGPVDGIPPGLRATGEVIEGIASWYGPGFHGLPTASGAIFDENLYTCANKELPLGTILLVTFEGRSVLVLVNDRGPFVPGRILDLSKAAKEAIGMGGLGYVTAQVLEPA